MKQKILISALLLLISLLGVILASKTISTELSVDEARSVNIAVMKISQLCPEEAKDNHPPLYYILLYFWVKIFGSTELSARSLSILFFIMGLFMVYKTGAMINGKWPAGIFAAFLYSFSTIMVRHAVNARMYSMLAFLFCASIYFFIKYMVRNEKTKINLFALLGFNILGIFTHYWFAFMLLSEFVYIVIYDRQKIKNIFLFTALPMILLSSVWLQNFIYEATNGSMKFLNTSKNLMYIFYTVFDFYSGKTGIMLILFLIAALSGFLLSIINSGINKTTAYSLSELKKIFSDKSVIFLLMAFLVTLILPLLISIYIIPIFMIGRYTVVIFIPFILLITAIFYDFSNKPILWACAMIFAVFIYINFYCYTYDVKKTNFRPITAYISKNIKNNDTIMCMDYTKNVVDYYLREYRKTSEANIFSFPLKVDSKHPCWSNDTKLNDTLEKQLLQKLATIKIAYPEKDARLWLVAGALQPINNQVIAEFYKKSKLIKKLYYSNGLYGLYCFYLNK